MLHKNLFPLAVFAVLLTILALLNLLVLLTLLALDDLTLTICNFLLSFDTYSNSSIDIPWLLFIIPSWGEPTKRAFSFLCVLYLLSLMLSLSLLSLKLLAKIRDVLTTFFASLINRDLNLVFVLSPSLRVLSRNKPGSLNDFMML